VASHPYISGAGNITQMVNHLRKSFPQTISSDTVKKLGLAPKNESYVINAIQFLGIIDEEGKRTQVGHDVFTTHKEEDFQKKFAQLVLTSYADLFELHGDASWKLSKDDLVQFFRTTDKTSDAIGQRQSSVFRTFASIAGYIEPDENAEVKKSSPKPKTKTSPNKQKPTGSTHAPASSTSADVLGSKSDTAKVGLTVRIEINLPAGASKEDYDNIFKSLRANIIDA
jgi:hypothetical protein